MQVKKGALILSTANKGKPFYVGNKIDETDQRLMSMKPTDEIPRLPRLLDQHFHQFKAAELQTWLLFCCILALTGILPDRFLNHLACRRCLFFTERYTD